MELQIFNFNENEVRTTLIENIPYFCLKDVCDILEIGNPSQLLTRLNSEGVISNEVPHPQSETKTLSMNFINESNLYKVIFQSRKPEAEKFTEWVTSEVLPSIRKHGAYMTETTLEQALTSPDFLIRLATELKQEQEKRKELELKNKLMQPKVEFYDAVAGSKDAIDIGSVAKVIGKVGRNRLFETLRTKQILMNNNQPYQKYVDNGCFRVIEQKFTKKDGTTCINLKTLVYQKGVDMIRKLVLED